MRTKLALLLAVSFACNKIQPAPVVAAPQRAAQQQEPAAANVLRGKVTEKIDTAQYTYLKLATAQGEVWSAVPKTDKAVGSEAIIAAPMWMENFKSTSLNRTWDHIAFGTLADESAAAAPAPRVAGSGAGMFAAAAANSPGATPSATAPAAMPAGQAAMPAGHPAAAPAAEVGDVKVKSAGQTIADIYAGKGRLKDKPITVRGKVVKATNGVMGKNWIHLRDGSGAGATSDLTVASEDTAKIGDTVLVKGTVHLDRDLGAGYHYDVLVEDAKIKTE